MASHKRSARQRQRQASLSGSMDMYDAFAHERRRQAKMDSQKEAALRNKACASKRRYATKAEALGVIDDCAAYGRDGLSCYRCPYCNGWHLTSHPRP